MRYQYTVLTELKKSRKNILDGIGIHYVAVLDTGKLGNLHGDGDLGINEFGKSVNDLTCRYFDGTDLYYLILGGHKTGGLNIEDHKSILKSLPSFVYNNSDRVIHKIRFQTVYDFQLIISLNVFTVFYLALFNSGIGESLHGSGIRNSYSSVTEGRSGLYET